MRPKGLDESSLYMTFTEVSILKSCLSGLE